MHRLPVNTAPAAIRTAALSVGVGLVAGAAYLLLNTASTEDAQTPVPTAPAAQPVMIPGHGTPGVHVIADAPVAAPATSVPNTPVPATKPPVKAATKAPVKTAAKPPAHSVQKRQGYTVYCNNGYLQADGSCTSTPQEQNFAPVAPTYDCGAFCGGASQGFDATLPGVGCNEAASLGGVGTPGCVNP